MIDENSPPLRIGLICPEMSGHLNPMCALGRTLKDRGHDVIFIGLRDGESHARSAGLEYCPIGEDEFPLGAWKQSTEELGRLNGLKAFRFTVERYKKSAEISLRDLPDAVNGLQLSGLVVDQTVIPGATIAERFGLPFVSLACALMMNDEPGVPPIISPWSYRDAWSARLRNRVGNYLFHRSIRAVVDLINQRRVTWNLPEYKDRAKLYSQLAQIAQVPREFDFPRRNLPPWFHYVGPLHSPASRADVPFPYENLNRKPLIYASMGTLQNRLGHCFQTIVDATRNLEAQLVLSMGGGDAGTLNNVPDSAIIVEFAPQLELLKRATLTITHAGLNTTMESLSEGVPMVCLPITNDQPAVAARVEWTQSGVRLPLRKLTPNALQDACQRVLRETTLSENARRLQTAIQNAGGLTKAADIVETALHTREPVFA